MTRKNKNRITTVKVYIVIFLKWIGVETKIAVKSLGISKATFYRHKRRLK